jgi:hypothetical protein
MLSNSELHVWSSGNVEYAFKKTDTVDSVFMNKDY